MKYLGKDPEVLKQFVTAAASGSISAGDTCIIETDGDIAAVFETTQTEALSSAVVFDSGESGWYFVSAKDPTSDYIAVAYEHNDAYQSTDANRWIVFGSISGSTVTFNAPIQLATSSTELNYHDLKYTDSGTILYVRRVSNSYGGSSLYVSEAFVITPDYNANTISKGTAIAASGTSRTISQCGALSKFSSNSFVFLYTASPGAGLHARVLTVSGTTVSAGSEATTTSGGPDYFDIEYDPINDKHLAVWTDYSNSNYPTAVVATVSGTSISFGTPSVVDSVAYSGQRIYNQIIYISDIQKFAFVGRFASTGSVYIGEISGTSSTWGSGNAFINNIVVRSSIAYDSNVGKIVVFYYDNVSPYGHFFQSGTISGTSVTFDASLDASINAATDGVGIIFDSSSNRILLAYGNLNNSTPTYPSGKVYTVGFISPNLTAENFIGFADKDYANGDVAVVQTKGAVDGNQTGLTAGQSYYVQTDGTLATTADDPSVFAGTAVSSTQIIVKG